jgi:hypothetical protein
MIAQYTRGRALVHGLQRLVIVDASPGSTAKRIRPPGTVRTAVSRFCVGRSERLKIARVHGRRGCAISPSMP